MSSALEEANEEFEDELRLQLEAEQRAKTQKPNDSKKTRVDDDGTVMEWDEDRRAWFPKIDDDFIASYQMQFGVQSEQDSAHKAWQQYATQLEHLKAEKGPDHEEVKKGQMVLDEYYRSPAYAAWYEDYQKRLEEHMRISTEPPPQPPNKKPRNEPALEVSAEEALERAEEEQRLGVPLPDPSEGRETVVEGAEGVPESTGRKRKKKPAVPEWYDMTDEKNTHVYVSGLPPSITDAAFVELMSKCGIIMNDPLTEKLRIKLYRDGEGKPKGDGRCCYIKIESVDLALQIIDGLNYEQGYTLHVERAKFQPRKDFDHSKHRRLTAKEKRKFKKQQENLFKWKPDPNKHIRSKKERVMVLRSVFDEADLGLDVSLIPEVRERVRVQCAKVGVVKKIVVYDTNPEGVVSVTFSTPEEADVALNFLNKALFTYPAPKVSDDATGQQRTRQLTAERWDGKERFDKKEDAEEEQERINRWKEFLGAGGEEEEDDDDDSAEEDIEETAESVGAAEEGEEEATAVDTDEELETKGADSGAETE